MAGSGRSGKDTTIPYRKKKVEERGEEGLFSRDQNETSGPKVPAGGDQKLTNLEPRQQEVHAKEEKAVPSFRTRNTAGEAGPQESESAPRGGRDGIWKSAKRGGSNPRGGSPG